jgi:uncharacterized protein (TIGR02186 family)
MKRAVDALIVVLFTGALLAAPRLASADLVAALSSHLVAVTTGFSGSNVLLFGTTDGEGDVVVIVRGPEDVATVHRKGRSMGIWVNEADMAFAAVPGFWTIAASRPLAEILPSGVAAFHQLGLEHLRLTPLEPTSLRRIAEFREALIRNRQREGLYSTEPGQIVFLGNRLFRTDLWIPANAPIGTYTVAVFLVRDGDVVSAETTPLIVGKVGFEARVFDFAHRWASFYGIIAVLLAAMAGWAANLAFRKD